MIEVSSGPEGVVLCASRSLHYVAQAVLASRSVRRFLPDVPITLFTDFAEHAILDVGEFDQVLPIAIRHEFRSSWATGKFLRFEALRRSPYERTLHLDVDARVVDESVAQIFEILKSSEIALVECHLEGSWARPKYGRPMFNGGVIAYRRTEAVLELFRLWEDMTEKHHGMLSLVDLPDLPYLAHIPNARVRRRLLCGDQVGLAQLLSPEVNSLGLAIRVLPESWNVRRHGRGMREPMLIDHSPGYQEMLSAELLAIAAKLPEPEAGIAYDAASDLIFEEGVVVGDGGAMEGLAMLGRMLEEVAQANGPPASKTCLWRAVLHAWHGQGRLALAQASRAGSCAADLSARASFPCVPLILVGRRAPRYFQKTRA